MRATSGDGCLARSVAARRSLRQKSATFAVGSCTSSSVPYLFGFSAQTSSGQASGPTACVAGPNVTVADQGRVKTFGSSTVKASCNHFFLELKSTDGGLLNCGSTLSLFA